MTDQTPKSNILQIIGAGGHAKVVLSTAIATDITQLVLLDDNPAFEGHTVLGYPILVNLEKNLDLEKSCVLAIGDNQKRKQIAEKYPIKNWLTLIHPNAYVHPSAKIGAGSVIFAGAVIQPDVEIGRHCIVNTGATIDHDCQLGDYVHIAPGVNLAGTVRVGEGSFLGIGTSVIPNTNIGRWSTAGAGSVIINDIQDYTMVYGVPAKEVKNVKSIAS